MVRTLLGDAAILVAAIIGIPLVILVLGTPIVLFARLLIEIARRPFRRRSRSSHRSSSVFPRQPQSNRLDGRRIFSRGSNWLELTMQSEMIALRRELRRKGEFIATLGHELRNPLSVLTTASLIFKMDGATAADMNRAAEIIGRQVQHVTRLINDLLDMERIDNGKLQLDVRPVDLREIVTNTLEARCADAERRKQSLTMQLTPDPVVVDADAVRLVQVVSNLVDNAVKYTPDEGHIEVAVTADGHGRGSRFAVHSPLSLTGQLCAPR